MSKLVRDVLAWVKGKHFQVALVTDAVGLMHRPDVLTALADDYEVRSVEDAGDGAARAMSKPLLILASPGGRLPPSLTRDPHILQLKLMWFDFFSNLHAPTLQRLDGIWLDRLYKRILPEDRQAWNSKPLGPRSTERELLRLLLSYTPAIIRSEIQVWEWLFNTHYIYPDVPEFLVKTALEESAVAPGDLKEFASSKQPFLNYVQGAWKAFAQAYPDVEHQEGPPFSHPRIAVYLDTYFGSGLLSPVTISIPERAPHWLKMGTHQPTLLEEAEQYLDEHIVELRFAPDVSKGYVQWFQELPKHALLEGALILTQLERPDRVEPQELAQAKESFWAWLAQNYVSLQSATNMPLMTHHILRWFRRDTDEGKKAALVIIDGLRLDQWQWSLRQQLKRTPQLQGQVTTRAVIAWAPTVTSLARQAIFAAQPPVAFRDSWTTTAREEALFRSHFAQNQYLQFFKQGQTAIRAFTQQVLQDVTASVVGIVINAVDDRVHAHAAGGDLPALHRDILRLIDDELFPFLLALRAMGYQVHVASDHGHTAASRQVKLPHALKHFSETRAQRAAILSAAESDPMILAADLEGIMVWAAAGLPAEHHYLLALPNYHFGKTSGRLIAHGGASFEEIVVPYANIASGEPL